MESSEQAYANFKSLNSFVAGISKERQDDVLNSVLLAQRAAQKAFPEEEQIAQWHEKYFEVLGKIGWVMEAGDFLKFETSKTIFELDKAVLDILGAVVPGSQLSIIMKTLESLKSLSGNDSKLIAFEKNTHSMTKGSFQIGIATEENGTLSMSSSAFILNTENKINKILFFKSGKDKTSLKYKKYKATLSNDQYSRLRLKIKDKLGKQTDEYIGELEI